MGGGGIYGEMMRGVDEEQCSFKEEILQIYKEGCGPRRIVK